MQVACFDRGDPLNLTGAPCVSTAVPPTVEGRPIAEMKGCVVRANRQRDCFVTREQACKVLDACPDAQWRLLFALSRFGGLRCPSEHLALRWEDIDLAASLMTVRSSKTEHHADGGIRAVPIFPELRPYLEDVWDLARPGDVYLITRYWDAGTNLRTQM
jgi:integrase